MTTTLGSPVYMTLEDGSGEHWLFEDGTKILWGHVEYTQADRMKPPKGRKPKPLTPPDYTARKRNPWIERLW